MAAGQSEPHTVSLATADAEGLPDVRVVMLHGADADGWSFATHADSRKGRHLVARPYAALVFYWPVLGRQVRLRGPVTVAPPRRGARRPARAVDGRPGRRPHRTAERRPGLAGRAGPRLRGLPGERAGREPDAPVPSWTLYRLLPDEVEFFQGDARRRHVRLAYRRTEEGGWSTRLLWP